MVWTVDLVSAPSYPRHPRHLPRPHHQSHTAHDTVELLARGHRRSSCTCNIKITVHPHAIRSRVRLPRASQPCSRPWAGTPSSRARCPTTSGLSARGHAGCGSDGIPRRCHWEERVTRGAHPLINSPHPHNPGVIPPHSLSLPFRIPLTYSMRAHWMPLTNFRLISPVDPPCRPGS